MKSGPKTLLSSSKPTLTSPTRRFTNGAGTRRNKCERNKDILKIPTIDEFGGYWKFQKENQNSIPDKLEIDLNEQVNIIDLDWVKEEALMKINLWNTSRGSYEREESDLRNPSVQSLSPQPKKGKRHRYWSDATNATSSSRLLAKERLAGDRFKLNIKPSPFFEVPYRNEFNFEIWNLDNFDNFCFGSMENNSESNSQNLWHLQVGDTVEHNFSDMNNCLNFSNSLLQNIEEPDHFKFPGHHNEVIKQSFRDETEKFFWEQ